MNIPVIFLVFANPQDNYLPMLTAERKGIEEALAYADKHRYIRCVSEASTESTDILKKFDQYRGQIKILHFGGHANGKLLALLDQKVDVKGLASLMKAGNENIELVFLNACATIGQVKGLLQAGVKNVIATTAKIKDHEASQFARQFYCSLAAGAPIKEAYQKAVSLLLLTAKTPASPTCLDHFEEIRSLESLHTMEEVDELPWGLYTAKNVQADYALNLNPVQASLDHSTATVHNYGEVKNQLNNLPIQGDLNLS